MRNPQGTVFPAPHGRALPVPHWEKLTFTLPSPYCRRWPCLSFPQRGLFAPVSVAPTLGCRPAMHSRGQPVRHWVMPPQGFWGCFHQVRTRGQPVQQRGQRGRAAGSSMAPRGYCGSRVLAAQHVPPLPPPPPVGDKETGTGPSRVSSHPASSSQCDSSAAGGRERFLLPPNAKGARTLAQRDLASAFATWRARRTETGSLKSS